jgi:hypothetical protein
MLRDLRPFLATIPKSLARKAQAADYAVPLFGDLLEWRAPYHHERGIDPADLIELNTTEVYVWLSRNPALSATRIRR